MKIHSILACLLIGSSTSLLAQHSTSIESVNNSESSLSQVQVQPVSATQSALAIGGGNIDEEIIGTSNYDLQTNSAIQPRFILHPNGSISAAWTMSLDGTAGFTDRGTGYNFFDGTSWGPQPSERLESVRTGWPSMVALPGGGEAYICHTSTGSGNSLFAKRDVAGTGSWTTEDVSDGTNTLSNVWHRMAVGGASNNTLHVIGAENLGTDTDPEYFMRYSRSTDLGATWDVVNSQITGIADSVYGTWSGDAYNLATSGDKVAFVVGSETRDVVLLESEDNGTTWSANIIMEFPLDSFDNNSHLIDSTVVLNGLGAYPCSDGSYNLFYDENDELQVYFGAFLFANSDTTDEFINLPFANELLRWKESYGFVTDGTASIDGLVEGYNQLDTIVGVLDLNGDGQITGSLADYRMSLTSMPNTFITAAGEIYLTYTSIIDTISEDQSSAGDPYNKNQRHQWITRSTDNGTTWADAQDLNKIFAVEENPLIEAVYGNVVVNGNTVYVMYQRDEIPGLHVRGEEHSVETNDMVVATFDKVDFDILFVDETNKGIFSVAPNPAFGSTTVNFVEGHENGAVTIVNSLGQTVFSEVAQGNTLTINTESFQNGFYIVNVTEGNNVYTQKLIVK